MFKGCNLAGGDTPYTGWGTSGPVSGAPGGYQFASYADVDYHLSKGQNIFRLLFTWEAVQPTEYAVLATLSGNYASYRDKLYALVDYITSKGAVCLLDIHGGGNSTFAAYRGVKVGQLMPSGQKVEDLLANVWRQLAEKYKGNARVWYGITNEPHTITPAIWFSAAQKVINSIRGTGSTSAIVMPGTAWTGAGSWISSGNAAAWNLVDPANNLHVQLHLYCDSDSSGSTTNIVSSTIAVERLRDAVAWARSRKLKIFLGEFGIAASNPIAAATWANLMSYVEANSDVFLGWAWWAAGAPAWWGSYKFTLCPSSSGDSAQMNMIETSFAQTSAPAPLPPPVDPLAELKAEIARLNTLTAILQADVVGLTADLRIQKEWNAVLEKVIAEVRAAVA